MGTRSGDIDPAIIEYIANKKNLSLEEMMTVLNKQSGVLGISEYTSDFMDLENGYLQNQENCLRAMKVFSYRVAKYIGAYAAAMNGVDAICFTAGLGENNKYVRRDICEYLGYLGVTGLNDELNSKRGEDLIVSNEDSKVAVMVIPTNEELAIARQTLELLK